MRALALLVGALMLVTSTACYNAHGIRVSELPKFNGYADGEQVYVQDWSGRNIDFDKRSKLYLVRTNGDTVGGKFQRIAVVENRFVGKTEDGKVINLLLPDVQEASVDTYSRGQTIAGIITAGVVVIGGLLLLIFGSGSQTGSCGHTTCAPPM